MNLQLLSVCFLGGAFVQTLLRNLFQDLQYAYRQLWKSPGFTITAVLSLSIGIGVNTASFSIMDAIVLRPVAVPDLNQVVALYEQRDHGDAQWITLGDFADWQRQSRSFEDMAVRSPSRRRGACAGGVYDAQLLQHSADRRCFGAHLQCG
jgi:hypothetical protein